MTTRPVPRTRTLALLTGTPDARHPLDAGTAPCPTCNHAFFRSVTTEGQAYWLGYIAGAAHIRRAPGSEEIDLCVVPWERNHLVALRTALASTHPIEPDEEGLSHLRIASSELVGDLARHGVVDTSPQRIQWPSLRTRLLPHYLRGNSDSDESWGLRLTKTGAAEYYLSRNRPFLTACQRYLEAACGLDRAIRITRDATLRFTAPAEVAPIARLLYAGATVFLPSKREALAPLLGTSPLHDRRGGHGDV